MRGSINGLAGKRSRFNVRPSARRLAPLATAVAGAIAGVYTVGVQSAHGQAYWVGGDAASPQEWNDVNNWSTNPSGVDVYINTATGNYPIVDQTPSFTPVDILVGSGANPPNPNPNLGPGRLDQTAGSLATGNLNWLFIGVDSGTGTYNLANTATTSSGTLTGFGEGSGSVTAGVIFVGGADYHNGGTGVMNVNTTGTITTNSNSGGDSFSVGLIGSGVLNMDNGTINADNEFWIAGQTGTGTVNQAGGTINTAGYFVVSRGTSGASNGTFNMTGGTVNAATSYGFTTLGSFSNGETATMNVSGGTFNSTQGGMYVAESNAGIGTTGSTGTLNVSGTGVVNLGTSTTGLVEGVNAGGVGTVNLNSGGVIETLSVTQGLGTGTFNFNGGTLRATGSSASFMSGLATAHVLAGGGTIDNNAQTVTVGQAISSGVSGANDGGMNFVGAGTTVLTGANTYTGPTVIGAGTTLQLGQSVPKAALQYLFNSATNPYANSGTAGTTLNGNAEGNATTSSQATGTNAPAFSGQLQLDGASWMDVQDANGITNFAPSGSWTLSAWLQTPSPGASILEKDTGAPGGGGAWANGNTIFYLNNASTTASTSGPTSGTLAGPYPGGVRNSGGFLNINTASNTANASVTDDNWHMVTYSDNGGTVTVYVDGQAFSTLTMFGGGDIGNLLEFGFSNDPYAGDGTSDFYGNMAAINYFNTALTAAQVQQLMTTDSVSTVASSPNVLPSTSAISMPNTGATLLVNTDTAQVVGSLSGVAGTTVTIDAPSLTTGGDNTSTSFAGTIGGSGGLIKAGTGVFTLSGTNTYAGATTVQGGKLVLDTNAQSPVLLNGGANIQGGALVLDYNGGKDPVATVRSDLTTSYNAAGGAFSSGQIYSSTAVADKYGLGYVDNTSTDQVTIMYTLYGDTNLDGSVNFADLLTVAQYYGQSNTDWAEGDFNYDGSTNFSDLLLLAQNYNTSLTSSQTAELDALSPSFAQAWSLAEVEAVPEPASLGLLAVGGFALVSGRRRRRS